MLKVWSQRSYIMTLLRDQGLPRNLLDNVFQSFIISKIRYCLPVWGVIMSQKKQINARLRIFFKCCFTSRLWDFNCLSHEVDSQLFKSMQNSQHCINCQCINSVVKITLNWYIGNVCILVYIHIYVLLCVLNRDQLINQINIWISIAFGTDCLENQLPLIFQLAKS